jgi:hypothetical protein
VKRNRITEIIGIFVGALLLLLSPLVIYYGKRTAMMCISAALSARRDGLIFANLGTDPLSQIFDTVIYFTVAGTAGFLIGLAMFVISITAFRRAGRDTAARK